MIGMIAAVTENGVIGIDNHLPFYYPEDLKHFKEVTNNCVVIMGRKTYESIGKPLPNRRNIVISSVNRIDMVEVCSNLDEAIKLGTSDGRHVWLIGGASIYEKGMEYVKKIVLTITPDVELSVNAIKFPWINPRKFEVKTSKSIGNKGLHVINYERIDKL